MLQRLHSQKIYEQLCQVIPGGVNSPVRACQEVQQCPLVAESGQGDSVFDADGNQFIDYCSSWGPLIHGHAHPQIIEAVHHRLSLGTSFGITTAIEEKMARKVVDLVPSIEQIRFVSSGTEATMSAVRLARAFTQRNLIVKFTGHYHGHADLFLVQAGSGMAGINATSTSAGIPLEVIAQTCCLPFNEVEVVQSFLENSPHAAQIAAVILEPVACNMGVVPATQAFMHMLRETTKKQGILLIFDEVITGFRLGLQGAEGYYGIKPDLSCFGKIIGGGFPAAAFGGRREIMQLLAPLGPVYQAGTLSGNPIAMEAGLQSLSLLQATHFFEKLEEKTDRLTKPILAYIKQKKLNACLQQVGSLFTLFFGVTKVENREQLQALDLSLFAKLFRYLFDRGVYIPPSQYEAWFISAVHTEEHLDQTKELVLSFLKENLH